MKISDQSPRQFGIDGFGIQNDETSKEIDINLEVKCSVPGKKMIVAGVALLALGALGAFLSYQKQNLIRMQNALQIAADGEGLLYSQDLNGTCSNSSTTFTKALGGTSSELYKAAKEIYNEATSNGTDLWSRFEYYAASKKSSAKTSEATFIICRANSMTAHLPDFKSLIPDFRNLISAPWKS